MTTTIETLAIKGGPKVRTAPFPPRQLFGEEEKQAAMALFDECIQSGNAFGYNGKEEQAYCREFVEFLGVEGYADMVNSGTTAVYVALRSLDLEPFTEVIVPGLTDQGGCMPVALLNCIPVPADCSPGMFNVSVKEIEARLTERTSAIVVAHIAGIAVDMDPIMELARSRNIPVVEDCAQAHGTTYKGRKVGTLGDVSCFSTMFGKHHATGGQGGVVFAKTESRYWNIRRASDRGKPIGHDDPAAGNVWAGLNLNQDEMGAAIGRVQLRKLPGMIERRRAFGLGIAKASEHIKAVTVLTDPPWGENAFWFLFARVNLEYLAVDKITFVEALAAEGLAATPHYMHTPSTSRWFTEHTVFGTSGYPWASPLYKGDPNAVYALPNIQATNEGLFTIAMHENCGQQEIDDIVAGLEKVAAAYVK